MRALNLDDYEDYRGYLEQEPAESQKLLDALTINLSYFFRNPETYSYIKDHIFSYYRKERDKLCFWSAGCAHGEEPYSLAISAAESGIFHRTTIYATDIDERALETAERGVYSSIAFQYTPEDILQRYFVNQNDGLLITKKIREKVRFLNFDIFEMPPFEACDIILCRNVLIYLDRNAQSIILRNFHSQLKPGGYLIIGKVELLIGIPEVKLFNVISRTEHVYQKRGIAA